MSEGQRQSVKTRLNHTLVRVFNSSTRQDWRCYNEDCINSPRRGVSCYRIVFPEPLHASKVSAEVLPIAVSITSLKGASRISVETHGLRITSFFGGYFIMTIHNKIRLIQRSEKIPPTHAVVIFGISIQFALESFYSC